MADVETNEAARTRNITQRVADALTAPGITVHKNAMAFGVPSVVVVLEDGSAYRLDLFELEMPTALRKPVPPPTFQINVGGATGTSGIST
jgi:hypothetical protein